MFLIRQYDTLEWKLLAVHFAKLFQNSAMHALLIEQTQPGAKLNIDLDHRALDLVYNAISPPVEQSHQLIQNSCMYT